MKRRLAAGLSFWFLLSLTSLCAEAVPIISVGSVGPFSVDTVFTVSISITNATELTSWQFDLAFDPAIVHADAVTEGPFLSTSGANLTLFSPGFILSGLVSGVSDFYSDLPPGPSGSGILALTRFHTLAPGISQLTLSNVFLDLSDQGFNISNGQVLVMPEPSSLALLICGLVLLRTRRIGSRNNQ